MYTQILTSKFGAELMSFKLNGEEKIHQGEEAMDENGKVYFKDRFSVLFPTVGKCKKNQTIMNSKTYEIMPDGFAKDCLFEPVTKLDNFHSYVLKSNDRILEKYPYQFFLYVTYRLDENKLTTIYKVINDGNVDMPFGIGSRPAFKIDSEDLKNGKYYLEFEEDEDKIHFLYLVDGLVGIEYAKNIMSDSRRIKLTPEIFKDGAIIMKGMKSKKVTLKTEDGKNILSMDYTGFPYLSLWTKPGSPFLCISPWMSTPDRVNCSGVFRQKGDIIIIPPSNQFECKYTVEFY